MELRGIAPRKIGGQTNNTSSLGVMKTKDGNYYLYLVI